MMTKEGWLYELMNETVPMSDEQIVQGFLRFYAISGLTYRSVQGDLINIGVKSEICKITTRKLKEAMKRFADREESRTLTEVQAIVDAVREGLHVQVDYYDPDIDDDPYVVRKCW